MIYGLQIYLTCHRGLQIALDSNRCIQQVWLDRTIENQDWQRGCASASEIVPQWLS